MNFDQSPEEAAVGDRARTFADTTLAPAAAAIDTGSAVPKPILDAALALLPAAQAGRVIAIEEVAAQAPAVGTLLALGGTSAGAGSWPGLRGVREAPSALDDAARVGLAAVAVGIGRAAMDEALSVLKAAGDRPTGAADERPHWVLADAATETDAARLLVSQAAQALDGGRDGVGAAAAAQVYANGAAQRAVEAALRVVGPGGYEQGSRLERLTRDARTLALVFGTEEAQRAIVADATLPG